MKYFYPLLLVAAFVLSACGATATPEPTEEATSGMPVPGASVTEMVVSTSAPEFPMPTTTYKDPDGSFSFDYPSDWMLDQISLGDRVPFGIQLTSWTHDRGVVSDIAPGGTMMNIGVQLWDPKNDLEAYSAARLEAWKASGFTVVSTEDITLQNGQLARDFIVQTPDTQAYFMITVLGDKYLVASGTGDIATIRLVAHSIR